MAEATLPIVDLQSSTHDLAAQLMRVGSDPGFFYLTGHELGDNSISHVFAIAQDFFMNAPIEEKKKFWDGTGNLGYTGMRDETLSGKGKGDLKESFYLADPSTEPIQPLPSILHHHRDQIAHFFHQCQRLSEQLLQAFAVGLDLKEDFLSSAHSGESCRIRFIHYPPTPSSQDRDPSPNSNISLLTDVDNKAEGEVEEDIRAGAHTDYGSITLLFRQPHDKGGLQVLNHKSHTWIDVPSLPNAIVVNIGDALEFWTAGKLRSTTHRVAFPRTRAENVGRLSIPFFVQPDPDVMLCPLLRVGEEREGDAERFRELMTRKGYESADPVSSQEHLMQRLRATYLTPQS